MAHNNISSRFSAIQALTLLTLFFTSCAHDPELNADVPVDSGTDKIMFHINIPGSALPPTRAIDDGGEADNAVENITILLFDEDDNYSGYSRATDISDAQSNNRKTFSAFVPDGAFDALVIANADDIWTDFQAAYPAFEDEDMSFFEENLTGTMIEGNGSSGYAGWNADPESLDFKPFPMAGRFTIPADRTGSLGTIFLTRMLVKIDVIFSFDQVYPNLDTDQTTIYRIQSIAVPNFNTMGNLIPGDTGGKALSVFDQTQLNIPAVPGHVSDTDDALVYADDRLQSRWEHFVEFPDQQCVDEIFLPEMNRSDEMCLLVGVFIPSLQQDRWFRVNMEMMNPSTGEVEPVNLLRNFRYTVNISSIEGYGFATPEEAWLAPAEGTSTDLNAVDESDMNDITSDGRNQLTVNKSEFVLNSDGGGEDLKVFTDYAGGWKIVSNTAAWFDTSIEAGPVGITTTVKLTPAAYTGNTILKDSLIIESGALRKTIYVIQVPAIENITADAALQADFIPYVGAFWKSNQMGERLIRIPRPTGVDVDGDWIAVVMQGKEWIQLDTLMTTDPNVGWLTGANESYVDNGNDTGFDVRHQVVGNRNWVKGTMNAADTDIYFRIGLNGPRVAGPDDPARYGIVLLAYNNYTKLQRIWIRQGEDADYLMSPGDPNGTGVQIADGRSFAGRFAPYNLTDPAQNTTTDYNASSLLPVHGGVFTDYPSQAGYFFQFNSNRALYPTPGDVAFSNYPVSITSEWDPNVNETCPEGYHRTSDNISGSVAGSEIRQSWWLNPQNSAYVDNSDNMAWGYYADGFFDRRKIVPGSGYVGTTVYSAVASPGPTVAYNGVLIYNPVIGSTHYNASLFVPAGGQITNIGTYLYRTTWVGIKASLWTSSSLSYDDSAWGISIYRKDMGDTYLSNQSKGMAFNVRCALD